MLIITKSPTNKTAVHAFKNDEGIPSSPVPDRTFNILSISEISDFEINQEFKLRSYLFNKESSYTILFLE